MPPIPNGIGGVILRLSINDSYSDLTQTNFFRSFAIEQCPETFPHMKGPCPGPIGRASGRGRRPWRPPRREAKRAGAVPASAGRGSSIHPYPKAAPVGDVPPARWPDASLPMDRRLPKGLPHLRFLCNAPRSWWDMAEAKGTTGAAFSENLPVPERTPFGHGNIHAAVDKTAPSIRKHLLPHRPGSPTDWLTGPLFPE